MRRLLSLLCVFLIAALMGACAAGPAPGPHDAFQPQDLNPLIRSGAYVPKVDSFLVILDASGTMYNAYNGHQKLDFAKGILSRMNQTIPDIPLTGGLRSLGQNFSSGTRLMYGMTGYSKDALQSAFGPITGGGLTPLATAVSAAEGDLQAASGMIALIVLSDGLNTDASPIAAAQRLKEVFGDRLCIYTVVVGEDPRGVQAMRQVADAGACGFSVNANDIATSEGMANFVRDVFLAEGEGKPLDSDGDGVPDNMDKCPGTPQGVKVDADGCPLDSDGDGVPDYLDKCPGTPQGVKVDGNGCPLDTDGDGVYDYMDKCPRTPRGAVVDDRGCWVIEGVHFDTDEATIKPQARPVLNAVASVLKQNPGLKVEVQGHTDSRGTDAYNMQLSERRAQAVVEYLGNAGIDTSRLQAEGYGESRPAVPNTSPENMAKNRRVELKPLY